MKKFLKIVSIVIIVLYFIDLRYSIYRIQNEIGIPSVLNTLSTILSYGKKPLDDPALTLIEKKHEKARDYFAKKQYDAAINECWEILTIDPKNVLALERMGSCYYQMGLKDKAMATWKKVLEIDPANRDVKKILKMFGGRSFSKTELDIKEIK
ncbi:MAG TPA: hypothetical protein DCX95_04865 [Elusimicrobia bacterium]|nr:hypothetical protein [Elusimicrobiota bacterium]